MTHFLASLPLWLSALLVVIIPSLLAMGCSWLVRRVIPLEQLATNNEVAGFKFAVLGVIYAVLLGFAVIVVWEKFRDAESAVVQEASGLMTIAHLLDSMDAGTANAVRPHLTAYVDAVIADDWPAMADGTLSQPGSQAFAALYASILAFAPSTPREQAIMTQLLTELDTITESRRTRLELAPGTVPDVLWWVLFASAIITLCFTFFFGTRSMRAQSLMSGMLAVIVFMALFVVIEIGYPFTGPVRVKPEALQAALAAFGHAP